MNKTCFENVYFSLILRRYSQGLAPLTKQEATDRVKQILDNMDLCDADVLRRQARRLSGGMLRRLALCNAIVSSPKILLLDEISAGVDPVVKRKIWKCIENVRKESEVSVVLTTHDTSEIGEMAQRITILDRGFTMVVNRSPYDLRLESDTYSVKFYNDNATCHNEMAEGIRLKVLNDMKWP